MPVIRPTEYMFKNYSHLGKEKWEIFAEVVRKIYCEIGGFQSCDMKYRDHLDYAIAMKKGYLDYQIFLNTKKKNE